MEERKTGMQKIKRDLEAIRLEIEDRQEKARLGLSFPQQPLSMRNPASSSQSSHVSNKLSPSRSPDFYKAPSPHSKRPKPTTEDSGTIQHVAARSEDHLNEMSLEGGKAEPVKLMTSSCTSQDAHIGDGISSIEVMSTELANEERRDSTLRSYSRIQAMKLRPNSRQGITLHRPDDVADEISHSTVQMEHVEELQSMIKVRKDKPTAHEFQKSKRLFHLKLEALELKRNGSCDIALRGTKDVATQANRFTHRVNNFARMPSATLPKSN